jgi:hypothetical protein
MRAQEQPKDRFEVFLAIGGKSVEVREKQRQLIKQRSDRYASMSVSPTSYELMTH